jgi:hypothetical protein
MILGGALGCSSTPDAPAIGQSQQALIGGQADPADTAVPLLVASLAAGGQAYCSAVVISPHVLATAAHCVDQAQSGPVRSFDAFFGEDLAADAGGGGTTVHVTQVSFDPAFDEQQPAAGHDVGIAVLASTAPVAPVPLGRTPLDPSWVGASVRLVGWGTTTGTDPTGTTAGVRREVVTPLLSYDSEFLELGDAGHGTCLGDSGGPAMVTPPGGGPEVVAALSSFGSATVPPCEGTSYEARTDVYAASFFDPAIARFDPGFGGKANGSGCRESAECLSGLCADVGGPSLLCTTPCMPGLCASGYSCELEQGEELCVPQASGCTVAPSSRHRFGTVWVVLGLALLLGVVGAARRPTPSSGYREL